MLKKTYIVSWSKFIIQSGYVAWSGSSESQSHSLCQCRSALLRAVQECHGPTADHYGVRADGGGARAVGDSALRSPQNGLVAGAGRHVREGSQ